MLLSALSRTFPHLHSRPDLQIAPLLGARHIQEGRRLQLDGARLHIRGLSHEERSRMAVGWVALPDGAVVGWRGSKVVELGPSPTLVARLAVFRGVTEPSDFAAVMLDHLHRLGAAATCTVEVGSSRGLEVKETFLKGYAVKVRGLDLKTSALILRDGLGIGTSMGAGVFHPAAE